MNERIRELAQEVFSFKYKSNPNELNPDHNMDHIHKFAELIVKECAEFARQHNLEQADRSHMIHRAIKQHFGVKE